MTAAQALLCGVELGGSKCVCLVGTGPEDIRSQVTVSTGSDARSTPDDSVASSKRTPSTFR